MTRSQSKPMNMLHDFRQELDKLFGHYLGGFKPASLCSRPLPPIAMWEDEHSVTLQADVPGISIESLDVSLVGETLTIKGYRSPFEPQGATLHCQEQQTGDLTRSVSLSVPVDIERADAVLRDGILTLILPKAAMAETHKVAVRAGQDSAAETSEVECRPLASSPCGAEEAASR